MSSSPAASRVVAAVSCRDRTDDRVGQADFDDDARRHQHDGQRQRDEEPSARDPRGGVGLAAHRLLVQAQQPIASARTALKCGSSDSKYSAVRSPDALRNSSKRR